MDKKRKRKNLRLKILRLTILVPFLILIVFILKFSGKKIEIPIFSDITPPDLTLFGKTEITILAGEEYIEQGFSAEDNGADLTGRVKINTNLDTNVAGEYIIEYFVADEAGNSSTRTRKVFVEGDYNFETKDIDFYLRSLEKYIERKGYNVSLGFYNFEKDYLYTFNKDKKYYGASLIKPVSALYLYENEAPLSAYKTNLIKSALTYSDNDAYASLASMIGVNNLKQYGESLGFTDFITDKNNNYYSDTTVENQLILWKKIWDFIKTNPYGEELESFLKNNDTNYIAFNDSIQTLHKYGSWGGYFHDVGIVLDDSPYIIIVLTKEGNNNYPKIIKSFSEKFYNLNKLIKTL